jgi:AcrR family transcriptional regulator
MDEHVTHADSDQRSARRADARRNRDRLIAAALEQFAEHGTDATVVGIARAAGVGVGTVYRHFPTRADLILAAYGTELDRVCDAVPALLAEHDPADAVRLWVDSFMDYLTSKFGIADAVREAVAAGAPDPRSRERLRAAMTLLFDAAARAGVIRSDVDVDDIGLTLMGIAMAADSPAMAAQRRRMIDLVLDGLATFEGHPGFSRSTPRS